MKKDNQHLSKFRIKEGPYGSDDSLGMTGAFFIMSPDNKTLLQIIAADGTGPGEEWEHVSVCPAKAQRTPTWAEMCFIKDVFWEPEETVIQFHPPQSTYINNHPYVLHLWRPTSREIPLPPSILVGVMRRHEQT